MQPKTWFFAVILCLLGGTLTAQTAATTMDVADFELTSLDNDDWSFYLDEDEKTFYIDFESVQVNLNAIKVKSATGEVIFKDDVYELPVNTIYEVDYSNFATGDYTVELHSFTGILKRKVTLK